MSGRRTRGTLRGRLQISDWRRPLAASLIGSLTVFVGGALYTWSLSPWDARAYSLALWTLPGLLALAWPRQAWLSGATFVAVQLTASLVSLKVLDPARLGWWPMLVFPIARIVVPLVTASTALGFAVAVLRARRSRAPQMLAAPSSSQVPSSPVRGSATLAALLEDLENLAESHPEVFDTLVREALWTVIDRAIVEREPGFTVPSEFGLFSDEANERLRRLLEHYVEIYARISEVFDLVTPEQRRASVLNPQVRSPHLGYTAEEFFGQG